MIRKIIKIDQDKCNGCGLCVSACHEGAIQMVDGKAQLIRDDYCDGLGDCLPVCPTNAISFEMREALDYNEEAVMEAKNQNACNTNTKMPCGCPGTNIKSFNRTSNGHNINSKFTLNKPISNSHNNSYNNSYVETRLNQWPVQIKLVPVNAPYFENANLLIAADCTAYAYGNFHNEFMKNHITLIGCPKLDLGDYSEKLTEIIKNNNIKSVTVVRMEVPCCGGIEVATKKALLQSGKFIPWRIVTISTEGNILD